MLGMPRSIKKSNKTQREKRVLLGLIEHYLKTGKPVGSHTLKEEGFHELSSATIRNYFAHLEKEGYLVQQHSSGGRLPTARSYRLYAQEYVDVGEKLAPEEIKILESLKRQETQEVASYLQESAELLSQATQTAIFLSAPRFDQDFIIDMKLIGIDSARCLCVLITNFGAIQTEILAIEKKLSSFSIKRIESYFNWRLKGVLPAENLTEEEEALAQKLYNELMVRYIVGYSHFTDEEIYRTGFSKLLSYTDFQDSSTALANTLALFENAASLRLLLRDCMKGNRLRFWIEQDLFPYASIAPDCAALAIPYYINKQCVGAIGLLAPMRIPYRSLFSFLREFSRLASETLTRSVYKFNITFRQPELGVLNSQVEERRLLECSQRMLLEDKRS